MACDQCGDEAVQKYTTERGQGPVVERCAIHAVPDADVGTSWVEEEVKSKK